MRSSCSWDDTRVDLPVPLEDSKDNCFPRRTAAFLAADAAGTEVTLIDLNVSGNRAVAFALLGHALANELAVPVDGVLGKSRENPQFLRFNIE